MNESIDNLVAYQPSPDALARNQRRDQQLRRRHRQRGGCGDQQRHQVGLEPVPRATPSSSTATARWTRTRGRTTARARRSRSAGRTSTAARSADRWSRTSVLLRQLPGHAVRRAGIRDRLGGPGKLAAGDLSSSSTTPLKDPVTGVAFAGNQIPASRISPIAARILNNTALYPLPNRDGVRRHHRQLRRRDPDDSSALTRATAASTGTRRRRTRSSAGSRFAEYESRNDKRAFPLLLGNLTTAPFRNLGLNWNRVFKPSLVNEVLVGYNQITIVSDTLDWAGIGDANASFGIAGGQPIPGLSSIGLGSGLTAVGARRQRYQHARQDLSDQREADLAEGPPLDQVRAASCCTTCSSASTPATTACSACSATAAASAARPSPTSCSIRSASKGRGQLFGTLDAPAQPDRAVRAGRLQGQRSALTLNLGHALGLHAAGRREGQPSGQLRPDAPARRFSPPTARARAARSTRPTRKASSRVSGSRGGRARDGSCAAPTAFPSTWKARAPTCGCRSIRRSSSSRPCHYDVDDRGRDAGYRLRRRAAARSAVGPGARVGSEPAAAVHAAVERLRRASADAARCRPTSATSGTKRRTWWRRSKATSRCPASAIRRPGRRWTSAVRSIATAPLITNISTTAARGRSDYNGLQASLRQRNVKGFEYLASYTLSRTRTNNLGYYGSGGVARRGRVLDERLRAGMRTTVRRSSTHGTTSCSRPTTSCRSDKGASGRRRIGADGCHHRRLAAERHLPGTHRVPDHRDRRRATVRCRARAATSGRTASATRCRPTRTSITGSTSTRSRVAPLGTLGNCPIGVARAPGYKNIDAVLAKQFSAGGAALLRVPGRGVQPDQHAELSVRRRVTSMRRTRSVRSPARSAAADDRVGVEVLLLTIEAV